MVWSIVMLFSCSWVISFLFPIFSIFAFSWSNSILYLFAGSPVIFRRSGRLLVISAASSIHRSPIALLSFIKFSCVFFVFDFFAYFVY